MEWKKIGRGLQCREHPTRKHGIKPDRYFRGRYRVDGKLTIVSFGWESEKAKGRKSFLDACREELLELKSNARAGKGPTTRKEKRDIAEQEKQESREAAEKESRENISFGDFFEKEYWPVAKSSKKKDSYRRERENFNKWISPVVGDMPFKAIFQLDVEKIKRNMQRAKRAPRTIEYVMATFRQVWNLARAAGLTTADSPSKKVKIHKQDNSRDRYLTDDEAERLLKALREKSEQTYCIALVSLDSGGRFSEIARLTWGNVDTDNGIIHYRDTKMTGGTKSRVVPMTEKVKELFQSMEQGEKADIVFPDKKGGVQEKISHTFYRCVKDEKLNEGIDDPRMKIVFHSLRHTYASRLVQSGVGLYTVQRLLGHSISKMTERYSHLSNDTLMDAVKTMERAGKKRKERAGKVIELGANNEE